MVPRVRGHTVGLLREGRTGSSHSLLVFKNVGPIILRVPKLGVLVTTTQKPVIFCVLTYTYGPHVESSPAALQTPSHIFQPEGVI